MAEHTQAPRKKTLQKFIERSTRGQRMGVGAYIWALHRLTGVILIAYLFLHLYVLSSVLQGPDGFDRMMETFETPLYRLLELALVGVVLFHTLNGFRLLLLHLWPQLDQKRLAYLATGITVLIVLVSLPIFLR